MGEKEEEEKVEKKRRRKGREGRGRRKKKEKLSGWKNTAQALILRLQFFVNFSKYEIHF